jgi:cytoskeletal protein CcmA (bactofilin family)
MFKKKYAGSEGSSSSLNAFLGSGTEYRGRLEFTGTVRVDGAFEGEIEAEGSLVLGRDASINGQVRVGTLISNGHVQGDVVVKHKAILQKSSALSGSLTTGALVVEEGAVIEGSVEMSGRQGEGPVRHVQVESMAESMAESLPSVEDSEKDEAEDLTAIPSEEETEAEVSQASRIS